MEVPLPPKGKTCLDWQKPYSVKRIVWASYGIVFEGNFILQDLNLATAERITAALNGAYNLGRFSITCKKD